MVPAGAESLGTLGFALLKMRAVRQHYSQQVHCSARRVHGALETERDETGEKAGVIDVRVRQQDEGDVAWRECERPVPALRLATALEHAAIDQEPNFAGVDEIAGTGDLARGTEESELHGRRGPLARLQRRRGRGAHLAASFGTVSTSRATQYSRISRRPLAGTVKLRV